MHAPCQGGLSERALRRCVPPRVENRPAPGAGRAEPGWTTRGPSANRTQSMRLVRRLTAYLLLAVGVVFGVDTFLGVTSHLALFDADMRRDERMLGGALARLVERAWREGGEAAAFELIETTNESFGPLDVRVVYLDRARGDPAGPSAPAHALAALERERALTHVRHEDESDSRLYTYVPLDVPGSSVVALELTEPLTHEAGYLRDRIRRKLTTAVVMALVAGLVAWLVGVRVVGRPVEALVAQARRIGRGDFSKPLALSHGYELSVLATEMNQMAAELEAAAQRVVDESRQRLEALEQLRHADRLTTVGKLASGLAHELGTPLNVVAGRAKMIASGEVESEEESVECARIIADQADRMAGIVRQLLDFARQRRGEKRPGDLCDVARQSVDLLQPLAVKQRLSLECHAPTAGVVARIDESQIHQALTNLVLNAIQAGPQGGRVTVTVASRREADESPLRSDHPGPWAVIDVQDEGPGIAAEALPQVFDPFYTTKPVGEGTGLGLSVSLGIAVEHGGWISVESTPGRGSCFHLWLPQEAA